MSGMRRLVPFTVVLLAEIAPLVRPARVFASTAIALITLSRRYARSFGATPGRDAARLRAALSS